MLLAAPQSADEEKTVAAWVEQLDAEEAGSRESAEKRLRRLKASWVPFLRKAQAAGKSQETKARLSQIVSQLLIEEGNSLYAEGHLPEALAKLAEGANAENPKDYVEKKIKQARDHLKEAMPPGKECAYDLVASEMKLYGLWAMPPLIELLGNQGAEQETPSAFVLQKMGSDAIPALCWAMGSKNPRLRENAANVLGSIRQNSKLAVESLLRAYRNPDEIDAVRNRARDSLIRITGAEPAEK